jgi:branched-chain amino acid transport system substrate-binding protein
MKLSGNVEEDRQRLRVALENLTKPVKGLVKDYMPPFTAWHSDNKDAHEALDLNDFCMASYDQGGIIRLKTGK